MGAKTTTTNQMVYGTSTETHTMPGITSATSKSRQSGPLEVVTTDADGNLASDGGMLFDGIAIAMAMEDPDLKNDERHGVALSWATFDGVASAIAASFIAVVDESSEHRLSVSGAVGVGMNGSGGTTYGGRVTGQLAW